MNAVIARRQGAGNGGGAGFYRAAGLERCFRDLQGARFHPVPEKAQTRLTGRLLLGLPFDA